MFYQKIKAACLLLIILPGHANCAEFFETNSINLFNNGPVLNLFSFSRPDIHINNEENALTLSTQFELTNYISSTSKNGDQYFIDGESWAVRNSVRYQISSDFLISASVPWIKHTGGKADNFIYQFHDIFQLPQNGRKSDNENDLLWVLRTDGKTLMTLEDELSGWGDISITGQLTPENTPSVRWSFMTKLPTGKYDKQTGSEEFDFGASVAQLNPDWFKNRTSLANINLAFWYGSGLSYIGKLKPLKELDQKSFIFTFRTGLAYSPFESWQLKCQVDGQTPLYDTEIRELGWHPLQISLSTKHILSQKSSLEFVIIEDIRPRSVSDVVFLTNLETTF